MPRTDDTNAALTGAIFAAIFVIMLVSFSRESYVIVPLDNSADARPMAYFFTSGPVRDGFAGKLLCPAGDSFAAADRDKVILKPNPSPPADQSYGLASEGPMRPCALR